MNAEPMIDPRTQRAIMYPKLKVQRDEKREKQVCINGPLNGGVGKRGIVHGPVVRGGKCQRCIDIYEGSK